MTPITQASPSSLDMAPALGTLEAGKCEELLKRQNVGRLAFALQDRVGIVPVHYVYDEGWIYGRTEPEGKLVPILRNRRVAFEVDEIRGMFSWQSVVVHGSFYLIEPDAGEKEKAAHDKAVQLLRRILPTTLGKADPVPFRDQLFRIAVSEITGRFSTLGGRRIEASGMRSSDSGASPEADVRLRDEVVAALSKAFPATAPKIHIDAFDGIIALTGLAETPAERSAIERETLRIESVRAVVQQLETEFPTEQHPAPAELARNAIRELEGSLGVARGNVKLVVEHDWLRLEGTLGTPEERAAAIRRVRTVKGTRGVIDRIHVKTVSE
jgi:nitroimidazol reductase NimA-like FMN-containing flavoprotein (pyridoxamine 5'-phosphate oxidase superfamily)/osmotically-inducible protein OsmY